MAVPAQLDVNAAFIADRMQGGEDRRKIHLAGAELQMIVNAAAHVLDVDVPQPILPAQDVIRDWQFVLTMQMPHVQRQAKKRMGDALMQVRELRHGVDQHARLRLEGQTHIPPGRLIAQPPATVDETPPARIHRRVLVGGAGPEANGIRVQDFRDLQRTP